MSYRKRTLEQQADRIEAVLARNRVAARVSGGIVTPRFVRFELITELQHVQPQQPRRAA